MARALLVAGLMLILIGVAPTAAQVGKEKERPKLDPEALFRRGDTNRDGKLSHDEFTKLASNLPRFKDNADLAKQAFARLDTNKDGFLSPDEFKKLAPASRPGAAAPAKETKEANAPPAVEKSATSDQLAFFEKKIRPVLATQCYSCHSASATKIKGGLVLDTREGTRKGGDSGHAVVPGDLAKSLLLKAIKHEDDELKMPPKKKLDDETIADFEKWIIDGAADPRDGKSAAPVKSEIDIEKGRKHWAFQTPKLARIPVVKNSEWAMTEVDRFLYSAMEAKGLTPVTDADATTLVRRLYFDLTGLPPTPEQVDAFVIAAKSNQKVAMEELVDRLLASPQFGERWGRHWLDVARYAESSGKQASFIYPHAWRFRDWVIGAINADKPYDQFLCEQIAGDLMISNDARDKAEKQVATGFLAIGPKSHNERDRLHFTLDLVDEQIDATFLAFQGLTVACARCHDHKFDPIPTKDYYSLAGIFRSTETCYGTTRVVQNNHPSPTLELSKASGLPDGIEPLSKSGRERIEKQIADLKKQQSELSREDSLMAPKGIRIRVQMAVLESQLALYDADGIPKVKAMGVREKSRGGDSPIYVRGEPEKPGENAPRGGLQVMPQSMPKIKSGSGRKELAEWLASPDNPLTARVFVNRVWLHLFGQGIVDSPDNFGAAGSKPSHPELLDALALQFQRDGYSLKKLIRSLVLTHAYRLSSQYDDGNFEVDPDNVYVWRHTTRRLDAEEVRDSLLMIAGRLESTPPKSSPLAKVGDSPARAAERSLSLESDKHRTIYLPILRDSLPDALTLFDFADPGVVTGTRPMTTVPAQSLFLMNNSVVQRLAEATAERMSVKKASDSDQVNRIYREYYGRAANDAEREGALNFLKTYATALKAEGRAGQRADKAAWTALCQSLGASAGFLYVE